MAASPRIGLARALGPALLAAAAAPAILAQGIPLPPFPGAFTTGVGGDGGGSAVALADLDGDGFADVAFGAPGSSDATELDDQGNPVAMPNRGRVVVRSGKDGSVLVDRYGALAKQRLGASLATGGDFDGDGKADLLAGGPGYACATCDVGVVEVLSATGGGALLFSVAGASAAETFGRAIACPGDVDGDGGPDLLVGAPGSFGAHPGGVRLFSGAAGTALRWEVGGPALSNLGDAVCGIGDVDLDGVPDAAAGAPNADGAKAQDAGLVLVLAGASGAILRSIPGPVPFARFGAQLADAGDLDGDGIRELAVAAPGAAAAADAGIGRIDLVAATTGKRLRSMAPPYPWLSFPKDLAAIGDPSGDGIPELAAGAFAPYLTDTHAFLFAGATGEILGSASAPYGDQLGAAVAGGGDLDGDGTPDCVAGAPGAAPGGGSAAGEARAFSLGILQGLGNAGKRTAAIALVRPGTEDPDAAGKVVLSIEGAQQRVALAASKLDDPGAPVFVAIESGVGTSNFVKILDVPKAGGAGNWKIEGADPVNLAPAAKATNLNFVAGRRILVRAGAKTYLQATLPSLEGLAPLKAKALLAPPQGGALPKAKGILSLAFKPKDGTTLLAISATGLAKNSTCAVFLENAPGSATFASIGTLAKGKLFFDTKKGTPLPLGLPFPHALAGRSVQVRDGATVVVEGAFPP